jgi:ubiquinone/menaquinone biosynthesis C-methylase UbiE
MRMDARDQSEVHYQIQAIALRWMMTPAAEAASEQLGFGAERRNLKILDIGAGSAVWSLQMAQRDPDSHLTAVDWPAVLEVAKATAEELGLSERLSVIPGNCLEIELPDAAFDLAVIANVCHLFKPGENEVLFRKARQALRPGGQVIVIDVFGGQQTGAMYRSLYALGLVMRTENGRVYGTHELMPLLEQSGFREIDVQPIVAPPHVMGMLVART